MIKCEICGREFKSHSGLSTHLKCKHDISAKDYYDARFKQKDEGICCVCGKPTRFLNVTEGYRKTCSQRCTIFDKYGVWNVSQSEEIKQKKKKSKTCNSNEHN